MLLQPLLYKRTIAQSQTQLDSVAKPVKSTDGTSAGLSRDIAASKSKVSIGSLKVSPSWETTLLSPLGGPFISSPLSPGPSSGAGSQREPILAGLSGAKKSSNKVSVTTITRENQSASGGKMEGAASGTGMDFFEGGSFMPSSSQYRIEITPRISVQGEYDDNVLLRKTNKVADYKTTLSPGIKISGISDSTGLDLDYEFGWVRYHKRTRNDYVQHKGSLQFWQRLSRHLTFRLQDYYIKSDDILAALDQLPVSQRIPEPETLQAYQSNRAQALLEYQFGPESSVTAGYVYNIMDNKDPNLEDVTEYGPFGKLSYWYNKRNGLELNYQFLRYDYSTKGTAIETRPDLERHDIVGRYIHRFGAPTSALIQYGLHIRDFPDVSVTYQIHDFSAGFEHAFSSHTSMALGAGYYRATGDTTIKPGYNFLARLTRSFERGSITLGATHSWDQGYIEVVPRGFTVYTQGLANANYNLSEDLNVYGGISYRRNDYSEDELDIFAGEKVPDDETYRGRCGVRWQFYRWFSLDLRYRYEKRISDDPNYDFDDNRITLILSASRPFKW